MGFCLISTDRSNIRVLGIIFDSLENYLGLHKNDERKYSEPGGFGDDMISPFLFEHIAMASSR